MGVAGQLNAVLPLPVALPPKKMWGNFNVDVVEARRAGFDVRRPCPRPWAAVLLTWPRARPAEVCEQQRVSISTRILG